MPHNFLDSPLFPILDSAFEGIGLMNRATSRVIYLNPALSAWLGRPHLGADGISVSEVLEIRRDCEPGENTEFRTLAMSPGIPHSGYLLVQGTRRRRVEVRFCELPGDENPLLAILVSKPIWKTQDGMESNCLRRDPLTGLHDRAFLLGRLAELLAGDRSVDQQFAVLFVDVDGFKRVNDAHGHLVGDGVLREIACRLASCVRDQDHVVRFGGDEFVVLAERIAGRDDIERIIDRIHAVLENPVPLPEGEITLTVSIGVTEGIHGHRSPEDILAAADRAMYASKRFTGCGRET
jgi:diguanylate cyclase (GGDEF)-like protein